MDTVKRPGDRRAKVHREDNDIHDGNGDDDNADANSGSNPEARLGKNIIAATTTAISNTSLTGYSI